MVKKLSTGVNSNFLGLKVKISPFFGPKSEKTDSKPHVDCKKVTNNKKSKNSFSMPVNLHHQPFSYCKGLKRYSDFRIACQKLKMHPDVGPKG